MNEPDFTKIELPICHSESGKPLTEIIEVERLRPDRYKLLYSPGVVEGLAKGDVIELASADPKGFTIVTRSGNLCVWFYFPKPGISRGPDGDRVRAAVEQFGGICDGGGNKHLIFSIPVSFGFPAVEKLLVVLWENTPVQRGCSATCTIRGMTSTRWDGGAR